MGIKLDLLENFTLDNYVAQLTAMVDALRADDRMRVKVFEVRPPATEAQLAAAAPFFTLTDDMRNFYGQCNGFKLEWELVADASKGGVVDVMKVEDTFHDWVDCIYFPDLEEDGDDEYSFRNLFPLDFFIPEACACLCLDGSANPRVWYHYCGESKATMSIDFREYLGFLLHTRGYWYWPSAFATDVAGQAYTTEPSVFRRQMKALFGLAPSAFFDTDYSEETAQWDAQYEKLARVTDAMEQHKVRLVEDGRDPVSGARGWITVKLAASADNVERARLALESIGIANHLGDYEEGKTGAMGCDGLMVSFERVE